LRGLANGNVPGPSFRDGLATDYVTDAVLVAAKKDNWEKVNSAYSISRLTKETE
jgi:hypothetical protein